MLNTMAEIGMVRKTRRPGMRKPMVARSTRWVRAPVSGMVTEKIKLGTAVSEGQTLALISNPLGTSQEPVVAPVDGIVIGRVNLPLAHEGDACSTSLRSGMSTRLKMLSRNLQPFMIPLRTTLSEPTLKEAPLKIVILSTNPQLYSTRRLVEAGKSRGHDISVISHRRCYMNITTDNPSIHYKGKPITGVDAIIPRIGASVSFYGTAVVRQFEMMGVYSVNESTAITRARDKLRALQLLSRKGIGLPVTGFANSPDDTEDLLNFIGEPPVVIKLLEGTQGVGVVLGETRKAAESVIEAFRGLKANFMVQEFIKERAERMFGVS